MIATILILHVFIGVIGVGASYAVVLGLVKRQLDHSFVFWASATAFICYTLTYLLGAYYFDMAYKGAIETVIRDGARPWVDLFLMESKGRVFLFLPFLSFTVAAVVAGFHETLAADAGLKAAVARVALVIFLIGVFVTVAGLAVSGAV